MSHYKIHNKHCIYIPVFLSSFNLYFSCTSAFDAFQKTKIIWCKANYFSKVRVFTCTLYLFTRQVDIYPSNYQISDFLLNLSIMGLI